MTIVTPPKSIAQGGCDNCHPPPKVLHRGGMTIVTPPKVLHRGGGDNCHPPPKYCTGGG